MLRKKKRSSEWQIEVYGSKNNNFVQNDQSSK